MDTETEPTPTPDSVPSGPPKPGEVIVSGLIIHEVIKEMKNSTRKTVYSIEPVPEGDAPVPTMRMNIQTIWTRKDGRGGPEKPEVYEIPSYRLAHLIQEQGAKK